jgi:MSHA biogenesis protein MshN
VQQPKSFEPMEPDSAEAREARRMMVAVLAARDAAPAPSMKAARAAAAAQRREPAAAHPPKIRPAAARTDSRPAQAVTEKPAAKTRPEAAARNAESAYRRALDRLQDGRMGETVAALEEALRIDPRHDAARQTLVGLLIEAGRNDEAMRQLQLGLAQDPRQGAMAMLLARLQIEAGGSGIETLLRTLPYAGNDAGYHAFLGGALARQGRHREAAEQYVLAVRGAPSNGVWWMGLGMSLQAEKRSPEALDAFQRARASGALSPELAGFVERRIQQLAR